MVACILCYEVCFNLFLLCDTYVVPAASSSDSTDSAGFSATKFFSGSVHVTSPAVVDRLCHIGDAVGMANACILCHEVCLTLFFSVVHMLLLLLLLLIPPTLVGVAMNVKQILPQFLAVGTGLGISGFAVVRNFAINPDVRFGHIFMISLLFICLKLC